MSLPFPWELCTAVTLSVVHLDAGVIISRDNWEQVTKPKELMQPKSTDLPQMLLMFLLGKIIPALFTTAPPYAGAIMALAN